MIVNEEKNNEAKLVSEHANNLRKPYEKPTLMRLDALDIGTGATNVPENNNGLLES